MKKLFRNCLIYTNGFIRKSDAVFDGVSVIPTAAPDLSDISGVYDNCIILPGFCDVHVHFREPGFIYKEDIATGSRASARGGYTAVCTMPNLDPCPDSVCNIEVEIKAIREKSVIAVYPFAALTVGEKGEKLSDMDGIAPMSVGFSDDGRGVQSADIMKSAMLNAKRLKKIISAHCEDNSLLCGGYIHKGQYAEQHGHRGISSESEWRQIERDVALAAETGCAYHVCHISTRESVDIIRKAKKDGVNITCETAPHYLLLDDSMLEEDGRFKMNPPIRSANDRQALIEGVQDGTIDMIATDHAPHSADEKSRGLEKSLMGISGIECAFPLLYDGLVKTGKITLQRLAELMSVNPRKRFFISSDTGCSVWQKGDFRIDSREFLSKGKSTPFDGWQVSLRNILTVYNGKAVYEYEGEKK